MTALTMESVLPYLNWYQATKENTKEVNHRNEVALQSCWDACIDVRKYFKWFFFSPEKILENFENVRDFRKDKLLDTQRHHIDHLKAFLSNKWANLRRLKWFDMEEFLSNNSIDEMTDYISAKFAKTVELRQRIWENSIKDLVSVVENDFLSHVTWFFEINMKWTIREIQNFYFDSLNEKKSRYTDEERHYMRDIIASLTEYRNNLIKQYKFMMRRTIYTKDLFPEEAVPITIREIKKPYIEKEKTTFVWSIVSKVKNMISKIF